METYGELKNRLIAEVSVRIENMIEVRYTDEEEIEEMVEDLIGEIADWELEHGVQKGIANPELLT